MRSLTSTTGKQVAFVASMSALGNVLALVTLSIPTPIGQIALDLSHVGTLVVALTCGPVLGGMTGALVGIAPFYRFGVAGGFGPLLGLLIIPGKSLTGISAGYLGKRLRPGSATLLGYVPEALFTYAYFEWMAPAFLAPAVGQYIVALVFPVLAKAWSEMTVIAIVMELISKQRVLDRLRPYVD